jgi:hypothetical protein
MKLLTHNMLACHIKGVQNGYPLKIEAEKVETREMDYEPDFLRHIFPRIQWAALREGAAAMGERRQHGKWALGPPCLFGAAALPPSSPPCQGSKVRRGKAQFNLTGVARRPAQAPAKALSMPQRRWLPRQRRTLRCGSAVSTALLRRPTFPQKQQKPCRSFHHGRPKALQSPRPAFLGQPPNQLPTKLLPPPPPPAPAPQA